MNPLSLDLSFFGSYESLHLDLPRGVVALVGPNGAGKSTIPLGIDTGLFGPAGPSLAEHLTRGVESTELTLTLTFEHGGDLYRIRRSYSARGRGQTKLDFEREEMDADPLPSGEAPPSPEYLSWMPLTRETAKETQALIEATTGLTRRLFRASCYLVQREGGAWMKASRPERMQILAETVVSPRWAQAFEVAKADRRAAEDELRRIEGAVSQAREVAAGRDAAVEEDSRLIRAQGDVRAALTDAETFLADVTERYRIAEAALAERRAVVAELEAARAAFAGLKEKAKRADEAARQVPMVEADAARLEPLVAELEGLDERLAELDEQVRAWELRVDERDGLLAEADRVEQERERLEREERGLDARALEMEGKASALDSLAAEECDRCGQALADDARYRATRSYVAEAHALRMNASALTRERQKLEHPARLRERAQELVMGPTPRTGASAEILARRNELRTAPVELGAARARLVQLQAVVAEHETEEFYTSLQRHETRVDLAEVALAAMPVPVSPVLLVQDKISAEAEIVRKRLLLDTATNALTRCHAQLEQIAAAEAKLVESAARTEELQREVDLLAKLGRAFGRDGIPALIVESVVLPLLEVYVSDYLRELGGPAHRVEFRTQKANKTNDAIRATLDIILFTDTGEAEYATFSGGEEARIDLALQLGLARFLNRSDCLIIDEPEGLDADGFAALARIVRELPGFDRIIVVSHHPDLRDAFDQVIEIQGGGDTGEPSRIVAPVASVRVTA